MSNFHAGLDLAEQSDFTALSVLQVTGHNKFGEPNMVVVHLERMQGVLYPEQVMIVRQRLIRAPIWLRCSLVVDATGVGRGPADMFQMMGIGFKGMIITGGNTEREEETPQGAEYHFVPKTQLVSAALIPFQQERLKISPYLPLAKTLEQEMKGFRLKQSKKTGYESFSHREGEHDDILLSVAMASWSAHRFGTVMPDDSLAGHAESIDDSFLDAAPDHTSAIDDAFHAEFVKARRHD